MWSTWGASPWEGKSGAEVGIVNTKVARRARAGQTFPQCIMGHTTRHFGSALQPFDRAPNEEIIALQLTTTFPGHVSNINLQDLPHQTQAPTCPRAKCTLEQVQEMVAAFSISLSPNPDTSHVFYVFGGALVRQAHARHLF